MSLPQGATVAQANSISSDLAHPRRPIARVVGIAVPSYRRAQFVAFVSPPPPDPMPSGKPRSWKVFPSDRRVPLCFVDQVPQECLRAAKEGAREPRTPAAHAALLRDHPSPSSRPALL